MAVDNDILMARKKEFEEEYVLEKAMHLFWEKGYSATSMQDLVEAMGISRSSMYDTYGDKRDLFLTTLRAYKKKYADGTIKLLESGDNVLVSVETILNNVFIEAQQEKCSKGCYLVNSAVEVAIFDKEINEIVNQNYNEMIQAFTKAVEKGQERGLVTTKHTAGDLATFIYNTISGMWVLSKTQTNKDIFDSIISITINTLKEV